MRGQIVSVALVEFERQGAVYTTLKIVGSLLLEADRSNSMKSSSSFSKKGHNKDDTLTFQISRQDQNRSVSLQKALSLVIVDVL